MGDSASLAAVRSSAIEHHSYIGVSRIERSEAKGK
jgi:hypothetical protein